MSQRRDHPEQFDPFRRPDWRWHLAEQIASGEIPRRRSLDDATKAAVAFRRCHGASAACPGRRRKGPHDAAIGAAVKLHETVGTQRWEVEARILAGQDDPQIAVQCGVAPETVVMYERLFFCVRDRLKGWAWISSQIFGGKLRYGFGDHDMGLIWMAIGYFGGPIILDEVIAASKACYRPGELPTVSACLAEGSSMLLAMQAMLAGQVLPPSREMDWVYIGIHLRLLEARMLVCPDAVKEAHDCIDRDMIKAARLVLAGKPVPRPGRDRGLNRRTTRTCSTTFRRAPTWAGSDDAMANSITIASIASEIVS